jgi:hypothetical protein
MATFWNVSTKVTIQEALAQFKEAGRSIVDAIPRDLPADEYNRQVAENMVSCLNRISALTLVMDELLRSWPSHDTVKRAS